MKLLLCPAIVLLSAVFTSWADAHHLVQSPIVDAGDTAGWRYLASFVSNIPNPRTRRRYSQLQVDADLTTAELRSSPPA